MSSRMSVDREEFNRIKQDVHDLSKNQAVQNEQMSELKEISRKTCDALTQLVAHGKDIQYIRRDMEDRKEFVNSQFASQNARIAKCEDKIESNKTNIWKLALIISASASGGAGIAHLLGII